MGERGGPPTWAHRATVPGSATPARSKTAIDRLLARRDLPLRKKTFYRLLYETVDRAEEILNPNSDALDLPGAAR